METPIGKMRAVYCQEGICELRFDEGQVQGRLQEELADYFAKKRTAFTVPLVLRGSPFQKKVWTALLTIPYGQTASYLDIACLIGQPEAVRAVGQAIGANPLAILIPCHRVIQAGGKIGGYNGGVHRKTWLLTHETAFCSAF